jgi:hypothetical protein
MFHPNTERIIAYWRARKGAAPALARCDLEPADIASLLPQVFMVGRIDGGYRLRLAGQCIVDAHGGARAGDDLLALWAADDRHRLRRRLDRALDGCAPIVIAASALGERGRLLALEITFAPMAGRPGPADRFLGLHQPLGGALGQRFAGPLRLAATGAEPGYGRWPMLRLASVDGRLVAQA